MEVCGKYEEVCKKYDVNVRKYEGIIKNNEGNMKKYVGSIKKYEEFFEEISHYIIQAVGLRKCVEICGKYEGSGNMKKYMKPSSPIRAQIGSGEIPSSSLQRAWEFEKFRAPPLWRARG